MTEGPTFRASYFGSIIPVTTIMLFGFSAFFGTGSMSLIYIRLFDWYTFSDVLNGMIRLIPIVCLFSILLIVLLGVSAVATLISSGLIWILETLSQTFRSLPDQSSIQKNSITDYAVRIFNCLLIAGLVLLLSPINFLLPYFAIAIVITYNFRDQLLYENGKVRLPRSFGSRAGSALFLFGMFFAGGHDLTLFQLNSEPRAHTYKGQVVNVRYIKPIERATVIITADNRLLFSASDSSISFEQPITYPDMATRECSVLPMNCLEEENKK